MIKNSPFLPFTYIFRGRWGHDVFGGPWGATPKHLTVRSGAERVRKLNELEQSGSGVDRAERERGWKVKNTAERERDGRGSVSGVTERGVSGERKLRPLPLRSHALKVKIINRPMSLFVCRIEARALQSCYIHSHIQLHTDVRTYRFAHRYIPALRRLLAAATGEDRRG